MSPEQAALLSLARALMQRGYTFVAVTPETHRRVLARKPRVTADEPQRLREIFGWNRPFQPQALPEPLLELLRRADAVEAAGEQLRSRVRFSSLDGALYVHSAFPTQAADAVFFGPDTYRFAALLRRWAPAARRVIDIGCGTGAGGLSIAERIEQLVLADVSARALQFCEVNAALAGVECSVARSDVLNAVEGRFDLIVANPPYLRDDAQRLYRDGGGAYGEALSVRMVRESLPRLNRGGSLIMYTGSAIVDGIDTFRNAVSPHLDAHAIQFRYEELDPDVFGEELDRPQYSEVERIAVVGLMVSII